MYQGGLFFWFDKKKGFLSGGHGNAAAVHIHQASI